MEVAFEMNALEDITSEDITSKVDSLLKNGEPHDAIAFLDKVITNKETANYEFIKLVCISHYIYISEEFYSKSGDFDTASALVSKGLGLLNKSGLELAGALKLQLHTTRASAYATKYDITYIKNEIAKGKTVITYDTINSIYDVKDILQPAITNYWKSLKLCSDTNESYNITNNLANTLSRMGRYIESLTFLNDNVIANPNKYQSYASWADHLKSLYSNGRIPTTLSFYIELSDKYSNALKHTLFEHQDQSLNEHLEFCKYMIKQHGHNFSDELIKQNKEEVLVDFKNMDAYRQYGLQNQLSLNEHSLYCFCRESKVDNLRIGLASGSLHVSEQKTIAVLDNLVNRIVSEYAYARLLYYKYKMESITDINDVEFSDISDAQDTFGYTIETIRNSYKCSYSILDKIANGVLLLFGIEKRKRTYFEDFFGVYKDELERVSNIHLAALYSMSLDLSSNVESNTVGSLGYFKVVRNEMEHGLFKISSMPTELDNYSMNTTDFEKLSFELLRLTRSAIFSFVHLIRKESIVAE